MPTYFLKSVMSSFQFSKEGAARVTHFRILQSFFFLTFCRRQKQHMQSCKKVYMCVYMWVCSCMHVFVTPSLNTRYRKIVTMETFHTCQSIFYIGRNFPIVLVQVKDQLISHRSKTNFFWARCFKVGLVHTFNSKYVDLWYYGKEKHWVWWISKFIWCL